MRRGYQPYIPVKDVSKHYRRNVHAGCSRRDKLQPIVRNHTKLPDIKAKAIVDSCAPKFYPHLITKLKKRMSEAARAAVIERDNRMLMDKMDHIMRTGGRTDHQNVYQSKSLNSEKYKRELLRVANENRGILKRLAERVPNYNHKTVLIDWQQNRQYLNNISKFPPPAWS